MTFRRGNIIFIDEEPDGKCAYCGSVEETRPYGKGGARICHPCAFKPENAELAKAMINHVLFDDPLPT